MLRQTGPRSGSSRIGCKLSPVKLSAALPKVSKRRSSNAGGTIDSSLFRYAFVIPVPCRVTGEKPVKAVDNAIKDCGREVFNTFPDIRMWAGSVPRPPNFAYRQIVSHEPAIAARNDKHCAS